MYKYIMQRRINRKYNQSVYMTGIKTRIEISQLGYVLAILAIVVIVNCFV